MQRGGEVGWKMQCWQLFGKAKVLWILTTLESPSLYSLFMDSNINKDMYKLCLYTGITSHPKWISFKLVSHLWIDSHQPNNEWKNSETPNSGHSKHKNLNWIQTLKITHMIAIRIPIGGKKKVAKFKCNSERKKPTSRTH